MIQDTGKLIQQISIFSDLSADEIAVILTRMRDLTLVKDEILFREGDSGDTLFVLLSGSASITVNVPGSGELTLAEIGAGSFIGEMCLIENLPRSATCRLRENSALLSLDKAGLRYLMENHCAIAEKILYRMLLITTERLHNTGALVSDMVQWGEKAQLRVITDEFTGLYNRRFLDSALLAEFRKTETARAPLSIVMVDLDHFGSVNKTYNEAFGDEVILKSSEAFKASFRSGDILARYGGDEFTFLLPNTPGETALKLCADACRRVASLEFPEHPDFRITASMGIATAPDNARSLDELRETADKALYESKEGGRNRATLAKKPLRQKHAFATIAERNRTVNRIFSLFSEKETFLLIGHELPDEDCISSLVSMALFIGKFGKKATIYIHSPIPDQLSYMVNICSYNKIGILKDTEVPESAPDVICVLDTPKPDMVALNPTIAKLLADPDRPIIELDHHLSADAAYIGSDGLCLVHRASSTCELIAFLCDKLCGRKDLMARFGIEELFSRNLVLTMLTGMIADTRFGLTMKENRDIFFYKYFSDRFAKRLGELSRANTNNYASMTEIFNTIQSFSLEEKDLYQSLLEKAHFYGRTGYVCLDEEVSKNYLSRVEYALFVKVIKSITDFLSEKSGMIGFTSYYEMSDVSDLIQMRIRASRDVSGIDLRKLLTDLDIKDGGGHPGAIGFRIPKGEMKDLSGFIADLLNRIEAL